MEASDYLARIPLFRAYLEGKGLGTITLQVIERKGNAGEWRFEGLEKTAKVAVILGDDPIGEITFFGEGEAMRYRGRVPGALAGRRGANPSVDKIGMGYHPKTKSISSQFPHRTDGWDIPFP